MPIPEPQFSAPSAHLPPMAQSNCYESGAVPPPELDCGTCRFESAHVDGGVWLVREGYRDALLADTAPDWFAPSASAGLELVKQGYARSTWRAAVNGAALYAKRHDVRGLIATVLHRVRIDRARREFDATLAAERRGVAVVRAVAYGRRSGASVFVSEEAPGAEPLTAVWAREVSTAAPGRRRSTARGLIEAVAALFAAAHERGFAHRDNHPGNILAAPASNGVWRVCFADVHGSRLRGASLSLKDTYESLAQLDQYFHREATRSERLRFWRAYWAGRGTVDPRSTGDVRPALAELAKARRRHARRLAAQRDRRLKGGNAYFGRLELGAGWWATVVLRLARRHVFAEHGTPDRSVGQWQALLRGAVLQGESASVARQDEVFLEEVVAEGWMQRIHWRLGGSPCRWAFEACHRARHRDQAADLVLGYAEHRRGCGVDRAMVIRPRSTNLEPERFLGSPPSPDYLPAMVGPNSHHGSTKR